jgi:putative DNA primase/helicase
MFRIVKARKNSKTPPAGTRQRRPNSRAPQNSTQYRPDAAGGSEQGCSRSRLSERPNVAELVPAAAPESAPRILPPALFMSGANGGGLGDKVQQKCPPRHQGNSKAGADILDALERLLPNHLADLRQSGLSNETIARGGYYSESDPKRLKLILNGSIPKRMGSALVIPFRDFDGNLNGYRRIKADNPRSNRDGKPIKYESPRGVGNKVYLPGGTVEHLADPGIDLFITEGEKKACKADQEGFPCLGLVGVFGWKDGRQSDRLLRDLEAIEWKGRRAFIVFDSDAATNENVRDAESRLAAQLQNHGAIVKVVRLPSGASGEKVGLDDLLVTEGKDALYKALNAAVDPEPVDAGVLKASANLIDAMPEARRFINIYALHTEGKSSRRKLQFWRGEFWAWDDLKYRPLSKDGMRSRIWEHLDNSFSRLTRFAVSNVIEAVKAQTQLPDSTEMPCWLEGHPPFSLSEILATRSGLVHLPSLVENCDYLHPLTPQFFSPNVLDYAFDIGAPPPHEWLKFLSALWPDDAESIATLQEWLGYLLTSDTSLQKILLVIGPRRSGKGTIGRVIRALIGRENVAGPTLAGLATNFGLSSLLGKTAAIISDARLGKRADASIVTERLLAISGEDALDIDRKHLSIVTAKLLVRFTLLTNEVPAFVDSSGALAGRMIILRLTESFFGREDRELFDGKLVPELPGILLWSIDGWKRLRDRGHFFQPQSGAELLRHMEDIASPISRFLRERCVINPVARVDVDEIYKAWCEWCAPNGRKDVGIKEVFCRDLHAALPKLRTVQPRDAQGRHRAYEGIGLLIQVGRS